MTERYYIAYGSNLSIEQMRFRTPDAVIVGTAMLKGWRLLFRQFATIRKSAGFDTPVLIWKISEQDEKKLDIYEDFPNLYIKQDLKVAVTSLDGDHLGEFTAMVYIMPPEILNARSNGCLPPKHYYGVLDAGYERFGFDKRILLGALREAQDCM